MAPQSRELSGVILLHKHYGSHLHSQDRTINEDQERIKFKFAGETLAEIWSHVIVDQIVTVAEYIIPDKSELNATGLKSKDQEWLVHHVCTSCFWCWYHKTSWYAKASFRNWQSNGQSCGSDDGKRSRDHKRSSPGDVVDACGRRCCCW